MTASRVRSKSSMTKVACAIKAFCCPKPIVCLWQVARVASLRLLSVKLHHLFLAGHNPFGMPTLLATFWQAMYCSCTVQVYRPVQTWLH